MAYIFGSIWDRRNRNALNELSESIEYQGKSIQDLVAEGQLTPTQYAQLIQTVNSLVSKGNVTFDDIDINQGKLLPKHLSEEVLKMVTGDAPVNAIPADGSLTTSKYADKSVTQNKTDFLKMRKNIFKKTGLTIDKLLSWNIDTIADSVGYSTQLEFVKAEPNTTYHRNLDVVVAFYGANYNWIGGVARGTGTYTTPALARYQRFSVPTRLVESVQVEKGESGTPYEPFGYELNNLAPIFGDNTMRGTVLRNESIPKEKMNFALPDVKKTKNLFNKDAALNGYFVNQTNGQIAETADLFVSEKTFIEEKIKISFTRGGHLRLAFYDVNGIFLSGYLNPESPIETPPNTSYFIVSSTIASIDIFQVAKGNVLPAYEPFGYTLDNFLGEKKSAENDVILNLPKKIYALVGEELNIYFDNIVEGNNQKYDFDVDFGNKGQQFEDFFRFVPDVKETRTLTFKVIKNNQVVAQKTSSVITSLKSSGSGTTRSVVIIGDSTTNNGIPVTKLNENFSNDSMNITTLGTRGEAPNKHEGRNGWTASQYVTSEGTSTTTNAFYNPSTSKFDFSYYLSNNSIARPNYVIINLGINDMFGLSSDAAMESKISEAISDYETMINSIKANSATIKIGLALTIPPNYSQDAFAKDYKTGQTRWRYKRNNILWVQAMIEHFSGKESQNIYLIPTNGVIDTKYNYGFVEEKVNARSEITRQVSQGNGGVHPVASGYWQIADAYWFWLKSFES